MFFEEAPSSSTRVPAYLGEIMRDGLDALASPATNILDASLFVFSQFGYTVHNEKVGIKLRVDSFENPPESDVRNQEDLLFRLGSSPLIHG